MLVAARGSYPGLSLAWRQGCGRKGLYVASAGFAAYRYMDPAVCFGPHAGLDLENQKSGMIMLDDAVFRLLSAFVKA